MMLTSKLLREQYVSKYTRVVWRLSTPGDFPAAAIVRIWLRYSEGAICRITHFTFIA
jgi:hypothetical protein